MFIVTYNLTTKIPKTIIMIHTLLKIEFNAYCQDKLLHTYIT